MLQLSSTDCELLLLSVSHDQLGFAILILLIHASSLINVHVFLALQSQICLELKNLFIDLPLQVFLQLSQPDRFVDDGTLATVTFRRADLLPNWNHALAAVAEAALRLI